MKKSLFIAVLILIGFAVKSQNCFTSAITHSSGAWPSGVYSADFNGDGFKDIVSSNVSSSDLRIYFGSLTGTFTSGTSLPLPSAAWAVSAADMNGDGNLDLVTANSGTGSIVVLLGTGLGTFTSTTGYVATTPQVNTIALADFNGDGKIDVVTSDFNFNVFYLLLNNGGGFNSPLSFATGGTYPKSLCTADFNSDGKFDIAVANGTSNNISVLLGTGTGSFVLNANYGVGNFPFDIKSADFNGDGKTDLAVCNTNGPAFSILFGLAGGSFTTAVNYTSSGNSPTQLKEGDFNGDSFLDIAIVNFNSSNVSIFSNNGSGVFSGERTYTVGLNPNGIYTADFNNDGKLDIVTSNKNSDDISILLNYNFSVTVVPSSPSICVGSSATLTAGSGNSFMWNTGSTSSSIVVSPAINASYSLIATTAQGCTSTATQSITVNSNPTASSFNNSPLCSGNTLNFTNTSIGASSYSWTGPNSFSSVLVNPSIVSASNINSGTYSLTSINGVGCSSTSTFAVIVNTTPTITVSSGSICSGKSFTMNVAGASTYTFSSGSNIVSPLVNTSYSVTGTSAQGCISTNTAISSVTVNITPTVTVNSGSICTGQSFTMNAAGATTYTYSSGTNIVAPLVNTNYSVSGTSAQGCVSSNTAISSVTVNITPTVSVNSGSICNGQTLTLIGSGANTYSWNGVTNNFSIAVNPTITTSYSITGLSFAGCLAGNVAVSTVTVNANPTITVNSGSICSGKSFTMNVAGASTYTFSSGSNIVSPLVNTSYSVTGTSAQGCISTNTAISSVTVNITPTVTVNSGSICTGQSFTMNAAGATTYTYSSGTNIVAPLVNTNYSVSGTSAQGCVSSNTAISSVTVNITPTVSVNSGSICNGQTLTLIGSGANTYSWNGVTNNFSIAVNPTITTSYSVTGLSLAGCLAGNVAVGAVTVNANPTITVNSGSICSGQSFTLVASGANSYTYSSGSNIVNPLVSTNYSVTGISIQGCVSPIIAISNITVNITPTISVNSGSICSGQSFTMNALGASTYTFSGGSNIVSPLGNTNYSVTGISAQGCVSSNTAISSVTVNITPTVTVNSGTICSGQSFTITANGANTYTYSGGGNIVNPLANSSYTVSGTSVQGCLSSNNAISSVTVYANPTITVNSGAICSGESFTLSPSGAVNYTYSGGSNIIAPLATNSYTIVGMSLQGCLSINPAISSVTVNPNPTVSINTGSMCSGQIFTISLSGANTYTLNPGISVASNFTVNPASTTQYSVIGTSTANCVTLVPAVTTITVNPLTNISGTVSNSLIPVAGEVTLFRHKPYFTKFDSITTQTLDALGGYNFPSVNGDTYILKANPTSNNLQVCYGSSAISWKNALVFTHNCITNSTHNVNVVGLTNIGNGPGSLSGKITEGFGYGHKGSNVATPGNPIGGVIVKGGRNPGGEVVSQGRTNPAGQYTLSGLRDNLAGESYFLIVDIPGLDTNGSYHRVIFTGSENYENLDFVVDSAKITPVDVNVGVKELSIENGQVSIYPNPTNERITIACELKKAADIEIELLDVTGRTVQSLLPKSHQAEGEVKIIAQLKDKKQGIYFVRLRIGDEERMTKIVVLE